MWIQMRGKVRREELRPVASPGRPDEGAAKAASDLLGVYVGLAERGVHLLDDLLAGAPPVQWERLPADDAVDSADRYQWFYHSHAPEDRAADSEHGHVHLFARRALWKGLVATPDERAFQKLCGHPRSDAGSRHLIAIGLNAKGLPISLFAVNSWVTGDLMLGAGHTAHLLSEIELDTGHPDVDRMIVSLARLCSGEIKRVLAERDEMLATRAARGVLEDRSLEMLAEASLDIDSRIENALA